MFTWREAEGNMAKCSSIELIDIMLMVRIAHARNKKPTEFNDDEAF